MTIAAVGLGVVLTSVLGVVFAVKSGQPPRLFLSLPVGLLLLLVSPPRQDPSGSPVDRS